MKRRRAQDVVSVETTPTVEGAERVAKHWDSFPQPAGWSVKWDFEELEKPPRPTDRDGQTDRAGDKV